MRTPPVMQGPKGQIIGWAVLLGAAGFTFYGAKQVLLQRRRAHDWQPRSTERETGPQAAPASGAEGVAHSVQRDEGGKV